ncbi:unnamed protein product, partial [Meganyctiphanes norvegica]
MSLPVEEMVKCLAADAEIAVFNNSTNTICLSSNYALFSVMPFSCTVCEYYNVKPIIAMNIENSLTPYSDFIDIVPAIGSISTIKIAKVYMMQILDNIINFSEELKKVNRLIFPTNTNKVLIYRPSDGILAFHRIKISVLSLSYLFTEFDSASYVTLFKISRLITLEVVDLQLVMVRDLDFDAHKTPLTVSFDDSCPLNTITGSKEVDVTDGDYSEITFKLESKLNYDENPEVICTLTATDGVNEGSTNIVITVEAGDMPPKFEEVFYKIDVGDESPGVPLTVLPKDIHAEDQGAAPTAVSYSMDDAEPSVSGTEYFEIDTTSADVTLIKVLDDEFIKENNQLRFVIYATDGLGDQDKAFLEINLPELVPTNRTGDYISGSPTTTHEPSGPVFLKDAYLFQTLQRMNYIGTVKATVDGMTSTDIVYSFTEENNEFRIDSSTGEISKKADIQVQDYSLTVTAEINGISHDALVNIVVHLEDTDASLCITNSLNQVTVQEEVSGATIGDVNYGEKDLKICVIYQEGEDDYNDVLFIFDGNTLKLNASAKLDREIVKQLRVWIQIFDSADVDCSNQYLDSGPRELKRSQSLFVIDVIDQNDHAPVFTYPDEDITLAYPEDPALQKVVGPVIHLRAIDKDDSDSVRYNILEDNTNFAVDAESGVVFWEGDDMGSSCGENGCSFNVKAQDQDENTSDPIKITVVSLPQEKIYTMSFPDMILSQVEERLTELSDEIEMTVKDLYVTPKPPILTARGGASKYTTRRNYIRSDLGGTPFNLDVHVSALKDGKAVSLERFNNALSAAEEDKAELFKDKEVFNSVEEPSGDVLGYQIALGVTGGLVAVILFALVIMGLIRHRKRSEKRRGPEVPDLRRSYGNQAYANDDIKHHDTLDGASLKMNGSVNGYHEPPRDDRRDSPPLNKSALAATSDTSPLYAAGGLRRTAPEEVPYLGQPASREPPSQFKEPKVSNEYVTSVSKAAEPATPKTPAKVKPTAEPAPTSAATSPYTNVSSFNQPRQKKEPPPLTAAPKKSALKGAGGTTSTASQKTKEPQIPLSSTAPVEPSADYDKSPAKTTTTSFSTLKKSPPPKKKEVVQAKQEEKEKEEEEDMAPERKKSNLKAVTDTESSDADNKRDQKERKSSVAFKVLVEEKTIEAQNEGPAAKKQAESEAKAEANQAAVDIMEANKKKLEDDEEDSDNIKL